MVNRDCIRRRPQPARQPGLRLVQCRPALADAEGRCRKLLRLRALRQELQTITKEISR